MDPEFITVLEIEPERTVRKGDIDVDDNAIPQVSGYGSEVDTENTNADCEIESRGINISKDLFASSAEVRGSFASGQSSQYLDWPEAPINVHSAPWFSGKWNRGALGLDLFGFPDVSACCGRGEGDESAYRRMQYQ